VRIRKLSKKPGSARPLSSRIYHLARTIVLAGIFGYLAWRIFLGRGALRSLTLQWNMLSMAGALLAGLLAYQCLFLGWLMLLRRAQCFEPGKLGLYVRIWWVSYLYRYVPGKLLLVVERARMGSAAGIPGTTGAALAIIETLLALLAGGAVSLMSVSWYAGSNDNLLLGVVLLSAGILVLLPSGFRLLCRLPLIRAKYPELQSISLRTRDILVVVVPYVLYYLLLGTSFFLVSRNLQLFSWSILPGLCGIYALSHVVSLLAVIAPGGLGVREGAFAIQLARSVPQGVADDLAIGTRVWFTLIEILCYVGVVSFCPAAPNPDRHRTT